MLTFHLASSGLLVVTQHHHDERDSLSLDEDEIAQLRAFFNPVKGGTP